MWAPKASHSLVSCTEGTCHCMDFCLKEEVKRCGEVKTEKIASQIVEAKRAFAAQTDLCSSLSNSKRHRGSLTLTLTNKSHKIHFPTLDRKYVNQAFLPLSGKHCSKWDFLEKEQVLACYHRFFHWLNIGAIIFLATD